MSFTNQRSRTPIGIAVAGASCLALLLGGCSSSGPAAGSSAGTASGTGSAGSSGTADPASSATASHVSSRGSSVPCTILTAANVRASFGGTVSAGSTQNPDVVTGPSCTYHLAGSSLGANADAVVDLPTARTPEDLEMVTQYPDPLVKIVRGVGDFATYQAGANTISFAEHGKVITVFATEVGGSGGAPVQPPRFEASLIALAKTVAARA